MYKIGHKMKPEVSKNFSRLSGKFLDCLESFRTVWKVSGQSEKFPDSLESFWIEWKVSG
jgi:hypothetical protein